MKLTLIFLNVENLKPKLETFLKAKLKLKCFLLNCHPGDSGVNSYSEMVRNPIRPDENAKHKKFDSCDGIPGDSSSSPSNVLVPKRTKSEIRDQTRDAETL